MKIISFLFLTFIASAGYSQIVSIPDQNFKTKLLSASPTVQIAKNLSDNWFKIDSNSDGQIQVSEAQQVSYLTVTNSNIATLIGITSFTNLKSLSCQSNQIATLDVSMLSQMEYLDCFTNPLTSLNVIGLTQLTYLDCSFTSLTSLDVSELTALDFLWADDCELASVNLTGLINLTKLYAYGNYFTTLNLTDLTNLVELRVNENNLETIDVVGMNHLEVLEVGYNQLTSIAVAGLPMLKTFGAWYNSLTTMELHDLPELVAVTIPFNQLTAVSIQKLPKLNSFYCSNNQIATLDFSSCPLLVRLQCSNNNLESINIKNGAIQIQGTGTGLNLHWNNNANLAFVCADENEIDVVQQILLDDNLDGVNINTYCSFVPGGVYNTIAGNIALDNENNGCDAADAMGSFVRFRMVDGTNTSYAFSNNTGLYQFFAGTGTFVVYPDFENLSYFTMTPPVTLVNFPLLDNSVTVQDFCLTQNGFHPDVEVVIVPIVPARPGFDAKYKIVYRNKGNQTLSGDINFGYDENVLDLVSSTVAPNIQISGSLVWNYTNLLPFESRSYTVTLNVNSPMETPPVYNDDVLTFTSTITPISGDETVADNGFELDQVVINSFDPNDKHCLEGNRANPSQIGDYLHYVINFENTGTAAAENVVVKDVIDVSKFDISSLQMMNSSHSVVTRITANKVEFIFENIQLQPNEHGNVVFKIKTKSTLAVNDIVTNKADIFFDYNFPIETNTATTTFQILATEGFSLDENVKIFPNPAIGIVKIKSDNPIKSVQLFDNNGRILTTGNQNEIDVSAYASGIYFLKIATEKGAKIEKVIKK